MNKRLIINNNRLFNDFGAKVNRSKYLILMIIPAIIFYIVFCYLPMCGILIAFENYFPKKGIFGSSFADHHGFGNFYKIFHDDEFWTVLRNTVIIGVSKLLISFVAAILMALIINEIRLRFFKKTFQTIVTFPHFLSWVIVAGLVFNIFGANGVVTKSINTTLTQDKDFFLVILYGSDIWKEAGWSSIIYLATMAGISPELYEAADIDGATRLQKIWHITLPAIKPTAILLLILSMGGILSAGFDQVFNLYTKPVYEVADILDTYIYRTTLKTGARPGIGAAVGLFKSVVSFILVIMVDRIAKLCGERGII